jgi:glycerol-3-phosphate dehydrogenase (NAD(P)+)
MSETSNVVSDSPLKVAVLGAGSWGTSLAYLLDCKGISTCIWARDTGKVAALNAAHENAKYLPGVHLQHATFTSDLAAAVAGALWIVVAVPCAGVPALASQLSTLSHHPDAILISGTKGLHPESGLRASQIWEQASWPLEKYVALSGPNLSKEIVAGEPTSTVVASQNIEAARSAQSLFVASNFRVYTNSDLIGVELGGALKNVVAIAAGIGDGLGFGDNAKAALLTRGWREMARLGMALGARESTLFGLSGMGDLFATCISKYSRNHALGLRLGRGESLQAAQNAIAQAVEGVHTTRAALHLAGEANVELPVTRQVAALLFEGANPRDAVTTLMARQERDECDNDLDRD